MKKYKPNYLGKVIPADDISKLKEFIENKFDSFSTIYDCCKEHSNEITDIVPVYIDKLNDNVTALSVKLLTTEATLNSIIKNALPDTIEIIDNIITAK